ncbi:MAG: hypothetical protein AAB927_02150 [Patescibacteria group bacterium]|jgi:hypothetical protein
MSAIIALLDQQRQGYAVRWSAGPLISIHGQGLIDELKPILCGDPVLTDAQVEWVQEYIHSLALSMWLPKSRRFRELTIIATFINGCAAAGGGIDGK